MKCETCGRSGLSDEELATPTTCKTCAAAGVPPPLPPLPVQRLQPAAPAPREAEAREAEAREAEARGLPEAKDGYSAVAAFAGASTLFGVLTACLLILVTVSVGADGTKQFGEGAGWLAAALFVVAFFQILLGLTAAQAVKVVIALEKNTRQAVQLLARRG